MINKRYSVVSTYCELIINFYAIDLLSIARRENIIDNKVVCFTERTAMALIDETFQSYIQLRGTGKDAKSVLNELRFRIELLPKNEQAQLVRQVREWEAKRQAITPSVFETKPAIATVPGHDVICSQCGKANRGDEVYCYACGYLLPSVVGRHDTVRFDQGETLPVDHFGTESTLVLVVMTSNRSYKIRPQDFKHEIVIGRSEGGTMQPDIDLTEQGAMDLGVSRLHAALQYSAKNNIVSISDMKSANGTYINGQKLYPQEVRVLRHGDELRLSRLVLRVYFHHPNKSEV